MHRKIIRNQLHQGERVYGIHVCNLGGSHAVKKVSNLDLDFVFIDMEHIPIDRSEVSLMCRYYSAKGISPVVRIPYPNPHFASAAIDGGAEGIVVPYVEIVEEVRPLVGAVHYRPLKGKMLNEHLLKTRLLKEETIRYLEQLNPYNYLIIGIESVPAYERLDELIGVEGVDAVFIGPHDLSVSMEIPEQYSHPDFIQVVMDIIHRSRIKGLGAGMHLKPDNSNSEQIKQYMDAGMNWILYSQDTDLLSDKTTEVLKRLRSL